MKKIKVSSELGYFIGIFLLSLSVSMIAQTNFGLSMIVSPAYLLSLKTPMTFGQSEYVVQGIMFIAFCIIVKRVKLVYFSSFVTGLIYGAILDTWRSVVPILNPDAVSSDSIPITLRVVFFALGMIITSISIAILFRVYLYPQVYDFFVKGVSEYYNLDRNRFKYCYDFTCLIISCVATLIMFHRFVGVGIGTVIQTVLNGFLIGTFGKVIDRFFVFEPTFKGFSKKFDLR